MGVNTVTKPKNGCMVDYNDRPIHAEESAMLNIKYNKNYHNKKITKLSMLVIRIDHSSNVDSYRITSSKPCMSCINKINKYNRFGYMIDKIYYSTNENNIVKTKIKDIMKKEQHVSKYYKNIRNK